MWQALATIFPLLLLIFQEFFTAQARAREEGKAFVLDETTRRAIANAAVQKWIDRSAQDSAQAGNAWDKADEESKTPDRGPGPSTSD